MPNRSIDKELSEKFALLDELYDLHDRTGDYVLVFRRKKQQVSMRLFHLDEELIESHDFSDSLRPLA